MEERQAVFDERLSAAIGGVHVTHNQMLPIEISELFWQIAARHPEPPSELVAEARRLWQWEREWRTR